MIFDGVLLILVIPVILQAADVLATLAHPLTPSSNSNYLGDILIC